jgi:Ca2+-binding EF-hand superfamily protein
LLNAFYSINISIVNLNNIYINLFREWYRSFLKECPAGVLRKADLHSMYLKILPKEDPAVIVDHLFRIFDRDNSGTIDFKEFVLATDITSSGEPEEKLRWTFRVS